jgi:thiol:disulfide interchange protein/DsbC/DsbD-like thiol-disulfide interchange protein
MKTLIPRLIPPSHGLQAGHRRLRWAGPMLLWTALAGGAPQWALAATPLTEKNPGAVVTTPQVRAELVAHALEGLAPGKPMRLGLKIEHQPHWHTYWKNPGDSGLPTVLEWTLPAGAKVGDIEWPTPHKLPIGPLLNYGFEGTLLLPVALSLPQAITADSFDVKLHAEWLVCKEVCIPESGDFVLRVPTRAATAGHAALFAAASAARPQLVAGASAQAKIEADALVFTVAGLPAAWQGQTLNIFPEIAGVLQNATPPKTSWAGGTWTARLPLDSQRSASPATVPVVLVAPSQAAGVQVDVTVAGAWPAAPPPPAALPSLGSEATILAGATMSSATTTPSTSASTASTPAPFGLALLLALLGGALLNLMPCVFPILSLKVLGFAEHASDRRALLAGGVAYTVGVVLSFVALAALLLALRAGGEQLGWGFQLQSPAVVAGLAALFTLIGLNLAGLFEFGNLLPSSWMSARARNPMLDAGLTGVLAVAVASPCTAPFMGASLGAAMTLPAVQALLVFAVLGLGMALPYLLASAWPRLAAALPKPGVWMLHFKTLMAFPMFATVVWLVWVLGQQAGIDGAAALLLLLLALAFAAWSLGSPSLGPTARRAFGAMSLLLMAATLFWAAPALRQDANAAADAIATGTTAKGAGSATQTNTGELWAPWSAERVAQARGAGRPVFVDFTAAWCVTCQFNKRSTLADAGVQAAFKANSVLLLRADWTRRDAAISAELTRLGRTGVPVYALYAAAPNTAGPKLLSEILSPQEVRAALAALGPAPVLPLSSSVSAFTKP